jgi:hypothetical protein
VVLSTTDAQAVGIMWAITSHPDDSIAEGDILTIEISPLGDDFIAGKEYILSISFYAKNDHFYDRSWKITIF